MRPKGWSDLPPDLLREIATRLHVATDFVSFHAVCKPWRNSPDLLSKKQLLPWLLTPTQTDGHSTPLKLRCVFSKSGYRVLPPSYPPRTNWVCSADGTAVWYLTVNELRPSLHDPITGAVTDLPCFPYYLPTHWKENPRGILYGDGTVFLYDISCAANGGTAVFLAALLRPGEAKWKLVDRTYEDYDTIGKQGQFCAAYNSGKILVTLKSRILRVITPGVGDVLAPRPSIPHDHDSSWERCSYILESHGELLWASVHVQWYYSSRLAPQVATVLMLVHALETVHSEKVRWVKKELHCLSDQVLFLGSPNSFAVDASLLGGQGGCAYFVCHNSEISMGQFGLFRYDFVDGKTELIQPLPQDWDSEKCTWFVPQPTIAPLQEIIKRTLEAQKLKKNQKTAPLTTPSRIFRTERHYEHRFRVIVYNLPPKVKTSHLQLFFSKHGKVSSTEVICTHNKNTKTRPAIGIVRIATMHARQADALAALTELDFNGCCLQVYSSHIYDDRQQLRGKAA